MKILGLTGDIACGKSSVARILGELGAFALDSDGLVRDLYAESAFAARVQALFEAPILDGSGAIDRARLGTIVFGDAAELRRLETLVHPAVAARREERLRALEAAGQPVVSIEAVKLLESGQGARCNEVWCVVCVPEVQLQRLMGHRGLDRAAAHLRLQSQPSRAAKQRLAGAVPLVWIENNGSLADLRALVAQQWTRFLA